LRNELGRGVLNAMKAGIAAARLADARRPTTITPWLLSTQAAPASPPSASTAV